MIHRPDFWPVNTLNERETGGCSIGGTIDLNCTEGEPFLLVLFKCPPVLFATVELGTTSHFSMRLSPGMALIATTYGMEYKLFAITAAELAALIAGAGGEDVASKRR